MQLRDSKFAEKLACCNRHWEAYKRFNPHGTRCPLVLEIGTGWHPIVPIGLYLCGADRIYTIDKNSLLRPETVEATLRLYQQFARHGKLKRILTDVRPDRVDKLIALQPTGTGRAALELLREFNIEPLIRDSGPLPLPSGSVQLLVSNNTLEEIPPEELRYLFVEFRRVCSRDGVMSHLVDMGDYYARIDPRISPYNYLKYSEKIWKYANNPIVQQNRLRVSDYRELHVAAGFQIVAERADRGSPSDLNAIRLAKEFARYAREDLEVLRASIVSVKSAWRSLLLMVVDELLPLFQDAFSLLGVGLQTFA